MNPAPSFGRLSKGDIILLTGVSGLIGSATAKEALQWGFRIRGITRDPSKLLELKAKFDNDFGEGKFEVCRVEDMTNPESYAPHLQGVSGVLHIASDASFRPAPREIIDGTVAATVGLLREAAKVPSVKAFTLTSSRVAAFNPPAAGDHLEVTSDTFLDDAAEKALATPATDPELPSLSYQASKVEGEKAAWEFYQKEKPGFALNTILPDWVNGAPVNPRPGFYSTYTWMAKFYDGLYDPTSIFHVFTNPPSTCVALRDVAALHIVSLAASEVNGERIFAIEDTWSAGDVVQAIQQVDAAWQVPEGCAEAMPRSDIAIPNQRFRDLIQKYCGRPLIRLDEAIAEVVNTCRLG
ncbi:aldehyde reductase II [Apiospora rasikravindrae]|uniref:Aldehyde reductase II n=1 Tax=Apiospora rasikravindrae TaxID=990691 RepID=A0ABR1SK60_9PEZI